VTMIPSQNGKMIRSMYFRRRVENHRSMTEHLHIIAYNMINNNIFCFI